MCDHNKCHTHPVKASADPCDQWSILDSVDEETLKTLISAFGLELQHDLPELKGSLNLMTNSSDDEVPER